MSSRRSIHEHTVNLRRSIFKLCPLETIENFSNGFLEVEGTEVNTFNFPFLDESIDHRDGEVDSVGFDEVVVVLRKKDKQREEKGESALERGRRRRRRNDVDARREKRTLTLIGSSSSKIF